MSASTFDSGCRSLLLAVLLLVGSAATAGATTATFANGFSSFSGGRNALAIGDFDADGDQDIAAGTTGFLGQGVFWYENDGGHPASFTFHSLLSGIGASTAAVAAADFAGNPAIDQMVSATGGTILLWTYSGGSLGYTPLGSANAVGMAPNAATGQVYLALGTDLGIAWVSGAVTSGGQSAPADTYRAVAVGNIDGGLDIVAGGVSGVRRCSSTSACFAPLAGSVDAYDVEIADLDQDGDGDIVAALNDRLVWFEFDPGTYPAPFFSPPLDIAPLNTNTLWVDAAVVDLDMDGDLDVVATDAYDPPGGFPPPLFDGFVAWFENDGAAQPSFTRHNIRSFLDTSSTGSPQVVAADDLDGDGDVDVVFGAADTAFTSTSYTAIAQSGVTDWRVDGTGSGALREGVGSAVAGGVDVNGDGYPDELVANRCGPNTVSCDSRVELYLGNGTGIDPVAAWTATGDDENDHFGYAVAFVGDVNADGYQDVGISAPLRAITSCLSSGQAVGEVYIWHGGPTDVGNPSGLGPDGTRANADEILQAPGSTNTLWYATCENSTSIPCTTNSDCVPYGGGACQCRPPIVIAFGAALVPVGDRTGDGVDDLFVGDPGYFSDFCSPNTRNGWGRGHLFAGDPAGLSEAERFEVSQSSSCSSCPCTGRGFARYAAAGDVDGNGLSDLAIGLPGIAETLVYLDSDSGYGGVPSQVLPEGTLGLAMADVDDDGYDDVLTSDSTAVYLYRGSISGNLGLSGWSESGTGILGVSAVGDLNGDCHPEIGVPRMNQPLEIFYGEDSAAGLSTDPVLTLTPPWDRAVAAGDVSRDGFDDVLVGDVAGGLWQADGGAAAVYRGDHTTAGPGDCDGDGSDRAADCNDRDATTYPGAPELCDLVDNDCDGAVDEGPDTDGDGVNDVCDNCPTLPNGPLGGSCVMGDPALLQTPCMTHAECGGVYGVCWRDQYDEDGDGIGDVCDPDTVPEPTGWLPWFVGIGALFALARRRRRSARVGTM